MAYNNFFNNTYQPYQSYPQFQPPNYYQTSAITQQVQQSVQPQIQNSGFVSVRNEQEARNYPIAPGNSVTFKDENQPYVYVKTMGFSQLDRPNFEKFRLVKEEEIQAQTATANGENQLIANNVDYALKTDLTDLQMAFSAEIETLKKQITELAKKKGVEEDG